MHPRQGGRQQAPGPGLLLPRRSGETLLGPRSRDTEAQSALTTRTPLPCRELGQSRATTTAATASPGSLLQMRGAGGGCGPACSRGSFPPGKQGHPPPGRRAGPGRPADAGARGPGKSGGAWLRDQDPQTGRTWAARPPHTPVWAQGARGVRIAAATAWGRRPRPGREGWRPGLGDQEASPAPSLSPTRGSLPEAPRTAGGCAAPHPHPVPVASPCASRQHGPCSAASLRGGPPTAAAAPRRPGPARRARVPGASPPPSPQPAAAPPAGQRVPHGASRRRRSPSRSSPTRAGPKGAPGPPAATRRARRPRSPTRGAFYTPAGLPGPESGRLDWLGRALPFRASVSPPLRGRGHTQGPPSGTGRHGSWCLAGRGEG